MRALAKTTSAVLVSVAMLAACGNDEETQTETENEETENVSEPVTENEETNNVTETGTGGSEDDEAESENGETSDTENEGDDGQSNESDNGGSDEEVFEPVEAGEEHEAAATKEDHYLQAGMVSGGEITDGKSVGNIDHGIHDEYERLVFDIYEGSYQELEGPAEIPNHFEVTKEAYPSRFVYTLRGIRGQPEELPDLSNMALFSHMEIIPYFDDAAIQLTAYVQDSVEFEVFEMQDPAKIVTDVRLVEREKEYAPVYSVRTASLSWEENLESTQRPWAEFQERGADHVRTLFSADNTLFVEEGYYATLEEAEARKAELEDDLDFELHIEERGMFDEPENIAGSMNE